MKRAVGLRSIRAVLVADIQQVIDFFGACRATPDRSCYTLRVIHHVFHSGWFVTACSTTLKRRLRDLSPSSPKIPISTAARGFSSAILSLLLQVPCPAIFASHIRQPVPQPPPSPSPRAGRSCGPQVRGPSRPRALSPLPAQAPFLQVPLQSIITAPLTPPPPTPLPSPLRAVSDLPSSGTLCVPSIFQLPARLS